MSEEILMGGFGVPTAGDKEVQDRLLEIIGDVTWQQQVTLELDRISLLAGNLEAFMETAIYDLLSPRQQALILLQTHGMALYATALQLRLEVDEEEKNETD
jgi:hypothetical protein